MSRFAARQRVFFIEEPVWKPQILPSLEVRCEPCGVWVVVPQLPEGFDEQAMHSVMHLLMTQLFREHTIERYLFWYYTPMAVAWTCSFAPLARIYDCMDELANFKGAPRRQLIEREAELFRLADLVFTGGQSLWEAKRNSHPNIYAFPSSVDVAHFARARTSTVSPADQAPLGRPRLGYAGVIDERMDLELLAAVADLRPDWQLVMLGPVVKIDPATLPVRPNIHYLSGKPYAELPDYMAGWDVAMLPFAHNDATRFISPTKTPEYLAAGLPVVSTAIRDVVRPYGAEGLVHIADTPAEFVVAVEAALATPRATWLARVDSFLEQLSWERTWAGMVQLIDSAIAARDGGVSLSVRERSFDYLVVGAGFAGAVIAERLAREGGKRVLVCDRRLHIGGNAYDCYDDHGLLIHRYGPHIFHTNSKRVFDYLSQFTRWRPYEHRVLASVDGQLLPIPINLDTINRLYGLNLSSFQVADFLASLAEPRERLLTSEDVVVSRVGRELYEKFFRGYTRKQWGLDPSELDASVIARVPTRTNRDDRYFTDTYQAMPLHGYTRMFENMLNHPNIKVMIGTDYRDILGAIPCREVVYTGPIDEFFNFRFGKLPYRSLEFRHETHDREVFQAAPVVNYPNEHPYTRITEFKYLTGQKHPCTSIVYEYPRGEGDPYYPVPRPENAELYRRYQALADATVGVHFVGRLATYKYYNMDQVVAQALTTYERIAAEVPRVAGG